MNNKVSIIMPVYNGEKFIHKAINSVLNQSYDNYELIIINDGSNDDTEKVICEFLRNSNKIIYRKQDNQGQSSARNYGMDLCNGEYIQFLDCDDYLERNALEILVNEINKDKNISFVLYGFNIWSGNKLIRTPHLNRVLFDFTNEYVKFIEIDKLLSSPCNKLYRFSYITKRFNDSCVFGEDRIFNYENLDKLTTISCIDNCLYNVVISANLNSVNKRYRYGKLRDLVLGIKTVDHKLRILFGDMFDEVNFMKKELRNIAFVIEQCAANRNFNETNIELKEVREDMYVDNILKFKQNIPLHDKVTIILFERSNFFFLYFYCNILVLLKKILYYFTEKFNRKISTTKK